MHKFVRREASPQKSSDLRLKEESELRESGQLKATVAD